MFKIREGGVYPVLFNSNDSSFCQAGFGIVTTVGGMSRDEISGCQYILARADVTTISGEKKHGTIVRIFDPDNEDVVKDKKLKSSLNKIRNYLTTPDPVSRTDHWETASNVHGMLITTLSFIDLTKTTFTDPFYTNLVDVLEEAEKHIFELGSVSLEIMGKLSSISNVESN